MAINFSIKVACLLAMTLMMIGGCSSYTTVEDNGGEMAADTEQPTACTEPRPQMCTMDYRPVCGTTKSGEKKTYSNGCGACSVPSVLSYLPGECAGATDPAVDESSINNVWHKAKLRGVSFRAIGQEPGWLLEITMGTEILLVLDNGQTRSTFPYVEPIVDIEERRTEFVLEDYGTVIEILDEPCRDVMSGEEFSVSVTIKLTDKSLRGCGRALH